MFIWGWGVNGSLLGWPLLWVSGQAAPTCWGGGLGTSTPSKPGWPRHAVDQAGMGLGQTKNLCFRTGCRASGFLDIYRSVCQKKEDELLLPMDREGARTGGTWNLCVCSA